jgi:cytochrome c-type biogenesis protein CcmH
VRTLSWVLAVIVAIAALSIGITDGETRSDAQRVSDISSLVKCPACRAESVRDSQSTTAENVRDEIARRVKLGQSDEVILDALASSFGNEIILTPPKSGTASLVWVLPVVGLVVAFAALAFSFRRWRAA